MNILIPTQIAYIAGIIDGEGTITLTSHKKGCYPSPTISIASTDYELLQWVKDTLGKGSITKKRTIIHKNIKTLGPLCFAIILHINSSDILSPI